MNTWVVSLAIVALCVTGVAYGVTETQPAEHESAATQPAAAATQTQPAEAGPFKTEQEKVSYGIGMNIAMGLKRQEADLDIDALARGLREGYAGEVGKEKISYGIGINIGATMKRQEADVDPEMLLRGLRDSMAGGETLMTERDMQMTLMAFGQQMMAKQQQQRAEAAKKQAEESKHKGEAFLSENAEREGVKVLPSGLQYEVLKEGDGPKPAANDTVGVHYRGTLINGTEFDKSPGTQPATFRVGDVVKGWQEALQLMPVGSKWKLYVPAELGYGERDMPGPIGPGETLIFEVELVEIK